MWEAPGPETPSLGGHVNPDPFQPPFHFASTLSHAPVLSPGLSGHSSCLPILSKATTEWGSGLSAAAGNLGSREQGTRGWGQGGHREGTHVSLPLQYHCHMPGPHWRLL